MEFVLGVCVGIFVSIALLLVAAYATTVRDRIHANRELRRLALRSGNHPSMYSRGSHLKVGPAIDIPLDR